MMTIQALRRSRGITLTDLALLSGIPARSIAAIEHGLQQLDCRTREQLAHVFGVPPTTLLPGPPPPLQHELRRRLLAEARRATPVISLALATAAILGPVLNRPAQVTPQAAQPAVPAAQPMAIAAVPSVRGLLSGFPAATTIAAWNEAVRVAGEPHGQPQLNGGTKAGLGAPTPAGAPDGSPRGCPIATPGRVVITQGYGVGTHAPADVWGALDLAVDSDGDGYGEIAASQGSLVFTPHAGAVRVALHSWPGGNYVRVTNSQSGWATAYAHLDQVFVSDGQWLEAGAVIGTLGNTGMSTGAHLHYEVWRNGVNVDPSPYVACG
jgi:murein DD-endopeptidase MepM/ murein hydrolase activator NlpD/DNA-binding XRE family transcriptional regulator